jgi:hypothetical protein
MTIPHYGPQDLLWPGPRYAELLAGRICRERAERARADGITWEQIGEALGLNLGSGGQSGHDLGVAAFEHFTGEPGRWSPASFRFRCAACGGHITDRGPRPGHPEDNEPGHAAGCVRLAADIAAWEAVGRPAALTITYEMIRSTITLHAAYSVRATPAVRR